MKAKIRGGPRIGILLLLGCVPVCCALQAQDVPPEPGREAAKTLVREGKWTAAEEQLRGLIAHPATTAEDHFLLGFVLFHERRYTDSLAEYTAGAKLGKPSTDDLLVVASDYIELKSYTDAERWLLYVTEHAPAEEAGWYLLGRTQYQLDHADDALASFKRSLEIKPKDLRAQDNLGLTLERLRRPDEAIAAYRLAIAWQQESGARDSQPYLGLGMLLLNLNREKEALPLLETAAKLGPSNPMCQQQLGLGLEKTGDNEGAIAAYKRASELAPNAEQPHFFLGRLLRKLGRKDEADAQFAKVADLLRAGSAKETPNFDGPTP